MKMEKDKKSSAALVIDAVRANPLLPKETFYFISWHNTEAVYFSV